MSEVFFNNDIVFSFEETDFYDNFKLNKFLEKTMKLYNFKKTVSTIF
jgi:hypothetical protein